MRHDRRVNRIHQAAQVFPHKYWPKTARVCWRHCARVAPRPLVPLYSHMAESCNLDRIGGRLITTRASKNDANAPRRVAAA